MLIYTRQSSGRKRKSKSKRLAAARDEHREFLASVGYTGRRKLAGVKMPDLKVENSERVAPMSETISGGGFRRSVDDWRWKRGREETADTIKEIERKKKQVAPAYNKGAVMYITEGTDPATLGRKI